MKTSCLRSWRMVLLLLCASFASLRAASLAEQLQKGLFEEEANHNLNAAIEHYQSIITATDEQRKITATALEHLAECYRKLGRQNKADEIRARLARDFSDQVQFATNLHPAPVDQTQKNSPSLNDFLGSERLTKTIEPELVQTTVARAETETALKGIEKLDNETQAVALPIIVPSILDHQGYGPTVRISMAEDSLLKNEISLEHLKDSPPTSPKVLELQSNIENEKKTIATQTDQALKDLAAAVTNNYSKQQKLESERSRVLSGMSADAALPVLQTYIRYLLSEQQEKQKQIARGEQLLRDLSDNASGHSIDDGVRLLQNEIYIAQRSKVASGPKSNNETDEDPEILRLKKRIAVRNLKVRKALELKLASRHAGLDALDNLLASAKADYQRFSGENPTAQADRFAAFARLLDSSPDLLNAANMTNKLSFLQNAAASGDTAMIQFLLRRGASVDKPTSDGRAPLHFAVENGHKKAAELLIKAGASINARDGNGETPFYLAAERGFTEISELLLQNGASGDIHTYNTRGNRGFTPLLVATSSGQLDEIRLLLANHADIESSNNLGQTALLTAVLFQKIPAAQLLISSNADVNVRDASGESPLGIAVSHSDTAVIKSLLDHGADPNIRNPNHQTPLMIAANLGNPSICELLLKSKADPNLQDKDGGTALHYAVFSHSTPVASLLLDSGANPNIQDGNGFTPLYYTCYPKFSNTEQKNASSDAAKLLLDHAAKIDESVWTAALASPNILKVLLEAKMNPNIKDANGKTPLDLLFHRGDPQTWGASEKLLRLYGGTNSVPSTAHEPALTNHFQRRLDSIVKPAPTNQFRPRLDSIVKRAQPFQTNVPAKPEPAEAHNTPGQP